jgi:small-conductance mechanosensitive channel
LIVTSLFAASIFLIYFPDQPLLLKGTYTFVALAIVYFIFEIVIGELLLERIKISANRYSLNKIVTILSYASYAISFLVVWLAETQTILISLGLIGAAIAFALQDIFKNFVGGIMIFINGIFRVGDRIEFNDKFGDVIDVGLLYTTLMEIRGWVSGDQVTGRLTIVPNGGILVGTVYNYTRDFDFMWDELTIPITYDSDWQEAKTLILDIVSKETKDIIEKSEMIMEKIKGKYYFTKRSIEPAIFLTLTDNWISFGIRYVTDIRTRRVLHDKLSRAILMEIEKSDKVKIASQTINITDFPPLKVKTIPDGTDSKS